MHAAAKYGRSLEQPRGLKLWCNYRWSYVAKLFGFNQPCYYDPYTQDVNLNKLIQID